MTLASPADFREASDAGVFLIGNDRALVRSVDFFTPIVDDPQTFGAVEANRCYVADVLETGARVDLLLDPQTSGGLLISVPEERAREFERALAMRSSTGTRIGRVGSGNAKVRVI
jgi:selenophosphate synthase